MMSRKLLIRIVHLHTSMRLISTKSPDEIMEALNEAMEKYNMSHLLEISSIVKNKYRSSHLSKKLEYFQDVLRRNKQIFQIVEEQEFILSQLAESEILAFYRRLLSFGSRKFRRLKKYDPIQLGYYLHLVKELIVEADLISTQEKNKLINGHSQLADKLDTVNGTNIYSKLFILPISLEMLHMFPVDLGKIILDYTALHSEEIIHCLLTLPEFQ